MKSLKLLKFVLFSLLPRGLQCDSKIIPFNFMLYEYPYLVNLAQALIYG